jgi:diphosphomevalonate decarboxylase
MRTVRVAARANIALIKYWGKAEATRNVPAVGSLSLTLHGLETETTVEPLAGGQRLFELDGRPMATDEAARIQDLAERLGLPAAAGFAFRSNNRFPTAAGLASSASGGAAAVVALALAAGCDLDRAGYVGESLRVSGSAPRSLVGGFARLDPTDGGAAMRELAVPDLADLRVLVAQARAGRKDVGSRDAMAASLDSPYFRPWVDSHRDDLDAAESALVAADWPTLWSVMEYSTLKMHALPLTSRPPVWYWTPTTLAILEAVRGARAEGLSGGFTMDAGPHVKLFCRAAEVEAWRARLAAVPGVLGVLEAAPGAGPAVEVDGKAEPWSLPRH